MGSQLVFAYEPMIPLRAQLEPLFELHYQEIAHDKDVIRLEPNWIVYAQLELPGNLLFVTARRDGELVGYASWVVTLALHYASVIMAYSDMFFLHPDYRGGMNYVKLMRASEDMLAAIGVKKVFVSAKTDHDFSPVMKRLKYKAVETNYSKLL